MRALIFAALSTAMMFAASANANATQITGPTVSATGSYEITWSGPGAYLVEYQASFEYADHWWVESTTGPLTRPNGTYQYAVLECTVLPFFQFYCYALAHHQVYVVLGAPPGVEYPQSPAEQAAYEYEIRAGDFTGNGRVDLLVDRTTIGAMDGSQQTFALHQNLNGSLTLIAPSAAQLAHARSFPLAPAISMVPGDMNGDGHIDHTLQNLSQVMGSSVTDEYLVFAPGSTGWPGAPIAIRAIDDDVRSFLDDLGLWFNADNHFAENAEVTLIPRYRLGYRCGLVWYYDELGLRPSTQCGWGLVLVELRAVVTGINLSALLGAGHIQDIFEKMASTDIVDADLWQLSQVVKAVFGVQAFGFADNGVRYPTNNGGGSPIEERKATFAALIETIMRIQLAAPLNDLPARWHDYSYESVVCQQGTPGCNLTNVACWGRRYPALFADTADHATPAANNDTFTLPRLGYFGPGTNPIKVSVGNAGGLPVNAVANIALSGHVFHRASNPFFCPQPMPGTWDSAVPAEWEDAGPWNECDQVYREPIEAASGDILMRTRGWGINRFATVNQMNGRAVFRKVDIRMQEAYSEASNGACAAN